MSRPQIPVDYYRAAVKTDQITYEEMKNQITYSHQIDGSSLCGERNVV